jgi:hypothetical protein
MPEKQKSATSKEGRWSINLDWYSQNQRSATVLVKDYLCRNCARQVGDKKGPTLNSLMATIHKCCSQEPDFINDKLPIMESVFRLFLRNGNRPLVLKEISSELAKVRYGDVYHTSPEMLKRIIKNDGYYGIQEAGG